MLGPRSLRPRCGHHSRSYSELSGPFPGNARPYSSPASAGAWGVLSDGTSVAQPPLISAPHPPTPTLLTHPQPAHQESAAATPHALAAPQQRRFHGPDQPQEGRPPRGARSRRWRHRSVLHSGRGWADGKGEEGAVLRCAVTSKQDRSFGDRVALLAESAPGKNHQYPHSKSSPSDLSHGVTQ